MYYDGIGELSQRFHEQTVSPVEVVEACLQRIEALNPTLNAFITVMADDAHADPGDFVTSALCTDQETK